MFNRYKFNRCISSSLTYLLFLMFHVLLSFLLFYIKKLKNYYFHSKNTIVFFFQFSVYLWYLQFALILSHDIETNPGPINKNSQCLTICHWNLNSISTDNFIKFPLLDAYILTHKFDTICLSETFLDSTFSDNDPRLCLKGYSLMRSDHPNNIKQGVVCIYYKDHLPLIPKPAVTQLNECLVCLKSTIKYVL